MPDTTWLERLRGKRTRDIELPNESGVVDPRLPPQPYDQLKKAFKTAKKISTFDNAVEGLKKAGREQ